jgi:methionyl-tRNA formyltransferase
LKRAASEIGVVQFWLTPEELLELSATERPDLGVVVAYGRIFQPEVLAVPRLGWVNLHFSLLPKFRGAAPVQAAILAGETETGVSVFQLDSGMDTGALYLQKSVAIRPEENASELLARLADIGAVALRSSVEKIFSGTAQLRPQTGTATYSQKFTSANAEIDFTQSAAQTLNQIRAFTQNPGAYFILDNGQRVIVERARVITEVPPQTPTLPLTSASTLPNNFGRQTSKLFSEFPAHRPAEQPTHPLVELPAHRPAELIATSRCVAVRCQDGFIELLSVRPSGKSTMPAADWVRGLKTVPKLRQCKSQSKW